MGKLGRFAKVYRHADKQRQPWFNAKWRLLVILATMISALLIRDYLEGKYLAEFVATSVPVFLVLDKVIYWFLVGIIFGAMAMWLMFEGEFAIGLYKSLSHYEKQVEREFGGLLNKEKTPAHRLSGAKKKRKK